MKKSMMVLAILLAASGALAGTDKDTGEVCQGSTCNGGGGGGGVGDVTASAVAKSRSFAAATGVGVANATQSVTVNSGGTGAGGGTYRVKNVPSVSPGGINPTVPCAIPLEGSANGVGFGVGFGTAYVDTGCEMRELIRLGLTSGDMAAEDKAARLLNRQLDKALAESDEAVASGPVSESNAWAWQTND